MTADLKLPPKDREILRRIAGRIAEIAAEPIMAERKHLWAALNRCEAERPMILTEVGGVMDEVTPLNTLECESDWARGIERGLRGRIFQHEVIGDDAIVLPRISYAASVSITGRGVEVHEERGDAGDNMGSKRWDAPLINLSADIEKLTHRTFKLDKSNTEKHRSQLEDVFGDILEITFRAKYWWTQGLTIDAIALVGLEGFMLAMYDQPDGLHQLMAWLRDDQDAMLTWYEDAGLLTPNNEDDYVCSGGGGWTDCLPADDYDPAMPGRLKDMWGLSESQETVSVSPEMFGEFVFPYQKPIIERFGLCGYGCCEPVEKRWEMLRTISNLRKISISPWSDQELMAQNLSGDYVFSRKPNPSLISTPDWPEETIDDDLRTTLTLSHEHGLNTELVMKDIHHLCGSPKRLGTWAQHARRLVDEIYG